MSDDLTAAIERLEASGLPDSASTAPPGEHDPKGIDEVVADARVAERRSGGGASAPLRLTHDRYMPSFMEWQVERVQERVAT